MGQKHGGRAKGTKNKRTVALEEKLEALGCDPFEDLVTIAQDATTPLELKVNILKDLLQYVAPKRKAIEVSGGDQPVQIEVVTGIDRGMNSAE